MAKVIALSLDEVTEYTLERTRSPLERLKLQIEAFESVKTPTEAVTKELERLRSLIPQKEKESIGFVFSGPTFMLGTLDSYEQAYLMQHARRESGDILPLFDVVRLGLHGWRGFVDAKGVEVPFLKTSETFVGIPGSCDVVSVETMKRIHTDYVKELAGAIIAKNFLTEQDEKNS